MSKEVNELPSEIVPYDDSKRLKEVNFCPSNDLPEQYTTYDGSNNMPSDKTKKSVTVQLISSAAILAIITTLMFPLLGANDITAEFVYLSCTSTMVIYEVNLSEYDEKSDVNVILYNDFTRREAKIDSQTARGTIENLKPNMDYTIAVVSGKTTILKQTVRTEKQ